jgi:hypothetical protein
MWTCRKRAAGSLKSPNVVTAWRETLVRWQDLQGRSQVRQSFCTPGHIKRCATSFTVALVPTCNRWRTAWNTWSGRWAGTYGPDLPAEVSQYTDPVIPEIGSSRAAGRWLTPGVFGARRRSPAMRPVRRKMVTQWWTRREIEHRRQRPVQRCAVCR